MRWAGHLALIEEKKSGASVLAGKPEVINHWEDLDIDGMIISKFVLEKGDERRGVDWIHHTLDRDQLWDVANTAITIWFC
jgi:hypothetical protein